MYKHADMTPALGRLGGTTAAERVRSKARQVLRRLLVTMNFSNPTMRLP